MSQNLEKKIDQVLETPKRWFVSWLDRFFVYTYRECVSGSYALFDSPEKLRSAMRQVRQQGYTNFDCFTPFPVHGLEKDMGLSRSKLPYITFFAGLTGFLIALGLQTGVHHSIIEQTYRYFDGLPNLRSYPLNIGGKPTFSWPAMVPIWFELTVLIGGHVTVLFLILVSKLFRPKRKTLDPEITNDKFCLWIPSDSKKYDGKIIETLFLKIDSQAIVKHIPIGEKPVS